MTGIKLNITLPADAWKQIQDALLLAWWDGFFQGLAWGLLGGAVLTGLILLAMTLRRKP